MSDLNSRETAASVVEVITRLVERGISKAAPTVHYGVVVNVTTDRKVDVLLLGQPVPSTGFVYGTAVPAVGDRVRCVIDPGGDRYVADVLGRDAALPTTSDFDDVRAYGATGDGTTDDTAAFQTALAALINGGVLFAPAGTYLISGSLDVPSRVTVRGAGTASTVLRPAAAFAGPVLRVMRVAGAAVNEFSQAYGQMVEYLTVDDTAIRSHACDGILVQDSDWVTLRSVRVARLNGYGVKMGDVARECVLDDVRIWRCGNPTTSKAALMITAGAAGDQTNTIQISNSQVVYSFYLSVDLNGGAGDGVRHIYFIGTQIEGGGGAAGGGSPAAYDLVSLGRAKNVFFSHCAIGNPGQGKYLINCVGYSGGRVQSLTVSDSFLGDYDSAYTTGGGGLKLDQVDQVALAGNFFATNPVADINVSASPLTVALGGSNIFAAGGAGVITGTLTNVSGRRGNIAVGNVDITPVANTPTSVTVTGLAVSGTTLTCTTSPSTGVPGSTVTETSYSALSSTGVTVWIYRTNTTVTGVSYQIIGS